MIAKESIQKAVNIVICQADPVKIIMFGSYARNEEKPDSDLDLLVVTKDSTENRFAMSTRLRRSLSFLDIPVDIIVHDITTVHEWAGTPGTLLYEVEREGRVLYEKT
jgi:uncharacterized protein